MDHISPQVLLSNALMREYGQLVNIKLTRVASVEEPTQFMQRRTKVRACTCTVKSQPDVKYEVKNNCLKVFKNQVSYTTKLANSLYYEVFDDFADTYCEKCNCKFTVIESKFQRCQKVELVALPTTTAQS